MSLGAECRTSLVLLPDSLKYDGLCLDQKHEKHKTREPLVRTSGRTTTDPFTESSDLGCLQREGFVDPEMGLALSSAFTE
jgi:hypothetical protein